MHLQVEKVYVKRCYVSMYNAQQNSVENLSIPKSRGAGDFSMQFALFAWNPETLVAEGFLDFNDQIYTTTIHDRLAELGARSIDIMTFQNNDGNHSAASALNRVRTVAKSQGFVEKVRGSCNPKLLEKADELLAAEKMGKNVEFDEKTQAAIKMSLEMTEVIKSNMATKEGLSHLEEITQNTSDEIKSSVSEINDKMSSYQIALANQAVMIDRHQETITAQQNSIANLNDSLISNDRKMMNLEKQNESQRFIIAKLNEEMRKKDQHTTQLNTTIEQKNQLILQLTQQNQAFLQSQGNNNQETLDQFKTLLAEFQETARKRKHDE
jgi:hypothetical protein